MRGASGRSPFHRAAAQETFGTLFPFREEVAVHRRRIDEAHEPADADAATSARRHSRGAAVSVMRNAGPAGA